MLPLFFRRHRNSLRLIFCRHSHRYSTWKPLHLPLSHPIFQIWSANTSLGKTLVSAGLSSSFLLSSSSNKKFLYLKPIQTGFPSDSDSRFVFTKLSAISRRRNFPCNLLLSDAVLKSSPSAAKSVLSEKFEVHEEKSRPGMCDLNCRVESKILSDENGKDVTCELDCKTLFAWEEAVSPHLAAERESGVVGDYEVVELMGKCLREGLESEKRERMDVLCVVETAGGVASPGPSGSLQCDLYRPFRLPGILVGDGRLGGISGTISAYESLKLRGYDIVAIVFEDHGLINEVPLTSYLRNRVPVLVLPPIPNDPSNDLMEWFDESHDVFNSLKDIMLSAYSERLCRLNESAKQAGEFFWWPFTQHKLVPEETVTVIDSRCGENFSVHKVCDNEFITQQFDACASWWTQGPDAILQTEIARDMGYTAARFGHVMFPENVYEPALECAKLLLQGVGKGWASRTFFSDNGSTAIEIALKMAFRKFSSDHGILLDFLNNNRDEKSVELKVLALKGSYHGDTLGAMEAQAPSPYTGFLQQPWYVGRGLFLDPPTVFMANSVWNISLPGWFNSETEELGHTTFSSRDDIFNKHRDKSDLAGIYSLYISKKLSQNSGLKGFDHIGALIIEPVIHAAGGMHMVDPLFQRVLVNECQNRKIPVIFDEVCCGFWRLGVETTVDLLGCVPDIACFAKLLTGGVIPLAATLASKDVFDSFVGDSKLKALLHGHSYSAHAMGCAAAAKAIKWFKDPQTNPNIISEGRLLKELWDPVLVQQISSHPAVRRVVVIGTIFALELAAEGSNAGYGSLYATSLLRKLRKDGVYMRPLGNVIYLMCGPCTSPEVCQQLLIKLHRRLEDFNKAEAKLI
ncbi:bifunctional dethiobiotin synthetase/7,8-diamino-pelargonic acid aminotransferase, mitochondrial-like isoform X2 [Mangifera indica]|uniref:bifunctional dethiobiotin synthetase/7,8-diamino-pelargonic acid aminotransferase, mitochondrial-like isoform X2 n=1 Tax=Mangifera indica TaxID=29780 RepID=UPI001CF9BC0E|nr:bifunctional dethiobiotin synthetase/7,8-diamino-pelargonic acid aminotransferase, mitochondrial-like isoform X2 [Mangifera indica]